MKNKVEPTEKQKRAADEIIRMKASGENVNKGEALRKANYKKSVQNNPSLVTRSAGFLAYMEDAGITEQNLAVMLAEDLNAKPGERLGELKLAAELMDLKKSDTSANVQVNVMMDKMRSIIDGEVLDDDGE